MSVIFVDMSGCRGLGWLGMVAMHFVPRRAFFPSTAAVAAGESFMVEYKRHILGEAIKSVTASLIGALIFYFVQSWVASDLEYRQSSRDAYLSPPLGQQGLTMAINGRTLKNVSIVEFTIVNRTTRNLSDIDLVFLVDDPSGAAGLVSAGIIPPRGSSQAETVEELRSSDPKARKFRLKVIPKQQRSEYYDAVFVFDGETAPKMSISTAHGEASVIPYREWKDTLASLPLLGIFLGAWLAIQIFFMNLWDYFRVPARHRKRVAEFAAHARNLCADTDPKDSASHNSETQQAIALYDSFTRPRAKIFLSKFLPPQRFD